MSECFFDFSTLTDASMTAPQSEHVLHQKYSAEHTVDPSRHFCQ